MDGKKCEANFLDTLKEKTGFLEYIIENCIFAYNELVIVNKNLIAGMRSDSGGDVNHLGGLNRMIQDYLIIRVGGLFDPRKDVVSFERLFSKNKVFVECKEQEIIKYVFDKRHNFVAHNNENQIGNNFPVTAKIVNSNLKEILEKMQSLLNKQKSA